MNNDYITFNEYGDQVTGCLKTIAPEKCAQAVIPTIVVENKAAIKNICGCFVHVANINTTFYIDDKHRIIVTWAGPVEANNYDYQSNPLELRSQIVYDFANNRAIYYNGIGEYRLINLTAGA